MKLEELIMELRLELAKSQYDQTKLIISSTEKLVAELAAISEKLDNFINQIKETKNDSTILQNIRPEKNIDEGA